MQLEHICHSPYINEDINKNFINVENTVNAHTIIITLLCIPHIYNVYKLCKYEYKKYNYEKLYKYND